MSKYALAIFGKHIFQRRTDVIKGASCAPYDTGVAGQGCSGRPSEVMIVLMGH